MAMSMPRDALVHFNGNRLSDHARTEVERTPNRIEHRTRTARGNLRKNYVADKWSFSTAWSRLPEKDEKTIDGHWGAKKIIDFFRATPGEFTMRLVNSDGTTESFVVVFNDFSYSVVARHGDYFYDISLTVEEV